MLTGGDLLTAEEIAALLCCYLYGTYPPIIQLAESLKEELSREFDVSAIKLSISASGQRQKRSEKI